VSQLPRRLRRTFRKPRYALMSEKPLTPQAVEEIRERWDEWTRSRKPYPLAVLTGGLTLKEMR